MEETEAHLEQTLLLSGEGELEECIESRGETHQDGLATVEPGELGEEEEDLVVEVVLQILSHYLRESRQVLSSTSRILAHLQRPDLAPGVDAAVEPEQSEGPGLQSEEEQAVVHHGVVWPVLASTAPAPASHHDRLPEVEPEVQQAARHLLLVREAELDWTEGDVEALDQPLLTDRHEDGSVRMAKQLVGDEAGPDLVVNLVLHLNRRQNNNWLLPVSLTWSNVMMVPSMVPRRTLSD